MVQTDLERLGTFSCSDDRLNKLHDIVEWSFRDNACEVPTDCPQREKAGWTGDWQLFVPTAAYLFDVAGFTRKWLNDVRADQWDNGVVANISPSPGPDVTGAEFMAFTNGSSGWGDAIVMVPWEIYLATGDTGILAENWEAMNRWLGFIRSTAEGNRHPARAAAQATPAPHEQYLWDTGFHFGEWMEPGGPAPDLFASRSADNGIVATAYYRHTSAIMAQAAAVLGRNEEARELAELSENVRRAWQQEYLQADGTVSDKTVDGGTQANCVRALAFDLVPDTARAAVTDQLAGLVRDAGTHLGTGFLATPYLLPALADNGRLDLAYELLMQDSEPSWLVMVDRGATTMWEAWDGIGADGSVRQSLNHYSKGAVVSFLHRYTAGLRQAPGSAGWEQIIIEPRPGAGLASAGTSHRGPQGLIEVSWTIDDGVLALTATVPSGTTAELRLPGEPAAVVGPGTHSFIAAAPAAGAETIYRPCKERTMTPETATTTADVTEGTDTPRRMPAPPPFPAFGRRAHPRKCRSTPWCTAKSATRSPSDSAGWPWTSGCRARRAGPVPLVVWIHGGAFQLGDRRELPPTFAPDSVFRLLNEAGIACATVDYRHALEAPFPAQLHDIKAAVRYLREHADVLGIDPERIGAWGESAGGHLAALLGVTGTRADLEGGLGVQGHSSSVSAVVDFYGVSSLPDMPPMNTPAGLMSGALVAAVPPGMSMEPGPMLVGGTADPALLAAASPLGYVTAGAAPFLLIHGDSDGLVPLSQSELLAGALDGRGRPQRTDRRRGRRPLLLLRRGPGGRNPPHRRGLFCPRALGTGSLSAGSMPVWLSRASRPSSSTAPTPGPLRPFMLPCSAGT